MTSIFILLGGDTLYSLQACRVSENKSLLIQLSKEKNIIEKTICYINDWSDNLLTIFHAKGKRDHIKTCSTID